MLRQIGTRSGRATKSASIDTHADDGGLEGEKTNIELVKGGKADDDVGIGTLCLDTAKEDGEADKDVNEENVSRRRAQSTDKEEPGIGLDGSGDKRRV